ncbi:MAG TPA: response regulator [Terriglobia bacterium]|nr:response regulator [Terriglobia bacterium]
MPEPSRPRILIVDDEELVLQALERQLHARFEVTTATGGKEALRLVMSQGPYAVVVSDLRMPGMDGVTLLFLIRTAAPDTVRILLTGHTDMEAASAAVNEGKVFRFLLKPCPSGVLFRALEAAVEQYQSLQLRNTL